MLLKWCQWLDGLSISRSVRDSLWLFPAIGWVHLYSMILLIVGIAALDLRLMGITIERSLQQPLPRLSRRVRTWAWIWLSVNAITGSFLFLSKAPDYYINPAFRIKMFLVLSGVVYHSFILPALVLPRATRWEASSGVPFEAKITGGFSLLLWVGVIIASQWIAA